MNVILYLKGLNNKVNSIKIMEIFNKYELSLGLEPFDVLGFKSEKELNQEIAKLIKVRSEFEIKSKVNSI